VSSTHTERERESFLKEKPGNEQLATLRAAELIVLASVLVKYVSRRSTTQCTALDTAHYVPHIQKGKAEERERETAVIVAVAHMTVS
jgi:hypothetical protein